MILNAAKYKGSRDYRSYSATGMLIDELAKMEIGETIRLDKLINRYGEQVGVKTIRATISSYGKRVGDFATRKIGSNGLEITRVA